MSSSVKSSPKRVTTIANAFPVPVLLQLLPCSEAKGTGVISASGGGGSDSVCTDCAGNYTDEELKWALIVLIVILSIFLLILCCQCFARVVNEYHRKKQLRIAKQQLLQPIDKQQPYVSGTCALHNLDHHQSNEHKENSHHHLPFSNKHSRNGNQRYLPTSGLCERAIKRSHTLSECQWQHEMAGSSISTAYNILNDDKSSFSKQENKQNRSPQNKNPNQQSNSKNRLKSIARASTMHSFKSLPPPPYVRNINAIEHI